MRNNLQDRSSRWVPYSLLAALFWTIFFSSSIQAQSSPPTKLAFLIGEWEARSPTNYYRMRVEWDKDRNQFRGFLTKQGKDLAIVGFRIGEYVWVAQPIGDPDIVIELQKRRDWSTGAQTWAIGEVDMEQSSSNALVTTHGEFSKVK